MLTATINEGVYDLDGLCVEIQLAMNAATANSFTYSVSLMSER